MRCLRHWGLSDRIVERYVSENQKEISGYGYEVLKGKRLKDFLTCVSEQDVPDINVGNISNRTPQLAIFSFRLFLNLAFLVNVLREMKLGQNSNGSAQPVVSGKKIYPFAFPLPPLEEQNRIADILESIIPICENVG